MHILSYSKYAQFGLFFVLSGLLTQRFEADKQRLSAADLFRSPKCDSRAGAGGEAHAMTNRNKLEEREVEKTCQPDLKSPKMNALELSPVQNIQRPPPGFRDTFGN